MDELQEAIGHDVIHIIPMPKFHGLGGSRNGAGLHTAIVLTPEGLTHRPEQAVDLIREQDESIVVIALLDTANDQLEQELLHRGCDDVMVAPICVDTLAARLKLRIKRRGWLFGSRDVVQLYGTTVDFKELRVYHNGTAKALSCGLAKVLHLMIENANQVVSRQQICDTIWSNHAVDPDGKNVDMHISKLRRLLEPQASARRHRIIKTVQGVGYRLEMPKPVASVQVSLGDEEKRNATAQA
jgi:DNA-binding response OmpR family regulator